VEFLPVVPVAGNVFLVSATQALDVDLSLNWIAGNNTRALMTWLFTLAVALSAIIATLNNH
jgi:hypothetical protein